MLRFIKRFSHEHLMQEIDGHIDSLLPVDFVEENVPLEAVAKMLHIKDLNDPIKHNWHTKDIKWKDIEFMKERVSLLDHLIHVNTDLKDKEQLMSLYKQYVEPYTEQIINQFEASGIVDKLEMDSYGRIFGKGSRKSSKATVWLVFNPEIQTPHPFLVNNRPLHDYFSNPSDRQSILLPFEIANKQWSFTNRGVLTDVYSTFKVFASASGGGTTGQTGSIRMGLARCLAKWHTDLAPYLQECN